MQNEFAENGSKLSQTLAKPLTELVELNTNTVNKITKNENLEALLQAKKPEEFFVAQMKFANVASTETIKHTQEACEIIMNAATQTGKIVEDIIRKATIKSADMAQSGINKVKEKVRE